MIKSSISKSYSFYTFYKIIFFFYNSIIDIIFKIASIGILTAVVGQILKGTGKDDISTLATLSGVIIVLFMVLGMIGDLFTTIKTLFSF